MVAASKSRFGKRGEEIDRLPCKPRKARPHFLKNICFDALGFRHDNPKLAHSAGSINAALVIAIEPGGLGRKNLDHKIGRALRAGIGQDGEALLRNENDVGLKDIVLVEDDVEGGVVEFTDRMLLDVSAQDVFEVMAIS